MKKEHKCWHFVMSSFARIYGIPRMRSDERIHAFSLEWCDEHNYSCEVLKNLDLPEVDVYFRKEYENWEG